MRNPLLFAVQAAVLILPAALLAASLAGDYWYNRDHAISERTHTSNPKYFTILMEYEVAGAVLGSLPGLAILIAGQRRQRADSGLDTDQAEEDSSIIWPPPPTTG